MVNSDANRPINSGGQVSASILEYNKHRIDSKICICRVAQVIWDKRQQRSFQLAQPTHADQCSAERGTIEINREKHETTVLTVVNYGKSFKQYDVCSCWIQAATVYTSTCIDCCNACVDTHALQLLTSKSHKLPFVLFQRISILTLFHIYIYITKAKKREVRRERAHPVDLWADEGQTQLS